MTTVSQITQANNGAVTTPPQTVVAASSLNVQQSLTPAKASITPTRFVSDPLSGSVITQFLNNNGDVVSQAPSSAVVAYLRNGLTADGFPREGGTTA